jgi:hypothetical protein
MRTNGENSMNRKTAIKVVLAALAAPFAKAAEESARSSWLHKSSVIPLTLPEEYGVTFPSNLKRLKITVAGRTATISTEELADALGAK